MRYLKKNYFMLFLVICLIIGLLNTVNAQEEKIIKIGLQMPLTGPAALGGNHNKAAVETAVEIINNAHPEIDVPLAAQEGVLDGYKFELIISDHQGIAERRQKLFMCGASSSAQLTERDLKYFFRMAPTDKTESIEFCDVLDWQNEEKGADIKTVGVVYENSEFGKHAANEGITAAKEHGYEVIADVAFSPGATNLNSEVQTLKGKNPDALFGAAIGADYILLLNTMKQMDWLPQVSLNYCSGYQDPFIAEQLGDDANYFSGSTGYSPEFKDLMPAVAAVEKIYTEKTGIPFDGDAIQEAIAMFILAQAIEKAGTLDTDVVRDTLYENEWECPLTLAGKVAFQPGGQNIHAKSLITQLIDGKYEAVFPPEYATKEMIVPMVPWSER